MLMSKNVNNDVSKDSPIVWNRPRQCLRLNHVHPGQCQLVFHILFFQIRPSCRLESRMAKELCQAAGERAERTQQANGHSEKGDWIPAQRTSAERRRYQRIRKSDQRTGRYGKARGGNTAQGNTNTANGRDVESSDDTRTWRRDWETW